VPRDRKRSVVVLGTGGNSLDIAETVGLLGPGWECAGFLDDDPALAGREFLGLPVLGRLGDAPRLRRCLFVNGIGSTRSYRAKPDLVRRTGLPPERFATLVHPSACVSPSAALGPGTAILQHAFVGARARVGAHVIVLPSAILSHDTRIGDFCSIAGGACLSGGVVLEPCCYVGSNATLREGVQVGRGALVGMGAVVLGAVPPGETWGGVPAKRIRPSPQRSGK